MLCWSGKMLCLKKKSLKKAVQRATVASMKELIPVERTAAYAFLLFLLLPPHAIYMTEVNCLSTALAWFPHKDTQNYTQFGIQHFMHSYLYYCNSILSFFFCLSFYEQSRLIHDCSGNNFILVFNLQLKKTLQKMDMELSEEALIPAE